MRERRQGPAEAEAKSTVVEASREGRDGREVGAASLANAGPASVAQRRLQQLADHAPQVARHSALQTMADRSVLSGAGAGVLAGLGVAQLETRKGTTLDGKTTKVDWVTDTLGGSTVGVKMTAFPLGPDHEQGGPPAFGAQKALMGALNTDPSSQNDSKYIRGHLLNDNLGGRGEDYNLFPLTGNANKEHHDRIEAQVKNWVNEKRQWVSYSVKVTNKGAKLDNSDVRNNYVNATFDCRAAVLEPSDFNKEVSSVSALITSEYRVTHKKDEKYVNPNATLPNKGKEAGLHDVKLSSSKRGKEYGFDGHLFEAIKYLYQHGYIDHTVDLFLHIDKVDGIGENTIEVYKLLIKEAMDNDNTLEQDLPLNVKSAITRMNNKKDLIFKLIKKYIFKVEEEENKDEDFVDKGVDSDDEIEDEMIDDD